MINGNIDVPSIMFGSFQQSDLNAMKKSVCIAIKHGCIAFDTAPSYGSEKILGKAIEKCIEEKIIVSEKIFLADKIDVMQMCISKGEIRPYVLRSLRKLRRKYLELLLIHWPVREYFDDTWRCMQRLKKEGLVKNIGVCNIDEKFYKEKEHDIGFNPDYIQNEISPLNVDEKNNEFFRERGVHIIAYSPLCRMCNQIQESEILLDIASNYKKTVPQIILKWHMQKNIIPIFSSHRIERIIQNLSLKDFELSESEIARINLMDMNYKIFPISHGCPGY